MRTSVEPPASGAAPGGIVRAFNRFSLKSLLVSGVGLVVLFCVMVAGYLQVSQGRTIRMMDSLINVDNVVTDLCLKSNATMVKARGLEKDFLLNAGEFGFDESRSRYVTRLFVSVAEIKEHMTRIRALSGEPETVRLTREVEGELDRYRQGIESLVETIGKRGHADSGAYGALRAEAEEIERLVRGQGSNALLVLLLEARNAEKDYAERARDTDAAANAEALKRFEAAAVAARLPGGTREQLRGGAARYRALFAQFVQATEAIRAVRKKYLRSVQAVEPLLEGLYAGSLERVLAKRRAIEKNARLLSLPVLVGGGVVLVLVALFSLAVAVAVSGSVDETKSFAERIASGDLDSRLVPEGRGEFRALAVALNTMAESLRAADVARERSLVALQESEERYRALVETSTDWIWAIDRQGRHTYSNERVREILGMGPEELLGSTALDVVHPEDVARLRGHLDAALAAGKGWRGVVLRWRHRDGTWRWLESSAVTVTDAQGTLVGFRGTDRDITERIRLEGELIRTQKLEAIGTLAGGIAHDFNNLLQGLFGYISLAKLSLGSPDRAAELLEQAEKALALSVNLTTQLLTFAKGGKPVMRRVALPAIIEDAAKFALSGSRSDYRMVIDRDLCAVDADGGQLAQVFQNLVVNASEAMPQGGTVEISARNETIAPGSNPLAPSGGSFVRVDVRDAGAGIPIRDLARIFDPYFTTKEKGSGLGLATSYSIARGHDGFIDVASRAGEGTVFAVYLPASRRDETEEPGAVSRRTGGRGRILVMDDDPLVRDVAAGMMAALGHDVVAVAGGEEAIDAFRSAREQGRPFDVTILDVTVKKGMGGEETLRRLLELDPAVTAVVSSGYSDAAVMADYRSHGFSACLNKPYRIDALKDCLDALLHPS